jgi:CRP/FNR family transcriptional regulator
MEHGEEAIVDMLAPCSIIGGANVLKEGNMKASSAVTVGELTEIAFLKKEDLPRIFQAHPELGIGFSRHISTKLREAYKLIADMRLSVEERLLVLLARIMVLLTGKCENGLIEIPFSHRELAQFAQITPETLSRALHVLQDKGIISVEKKGLRVLQVEELRKYVDETN